MKMGAQMFTVRDFCKVLTAFSETLKKIADIGNNGEKPFDCLKRSYDRLKSWDLHKMRTSGGYSHA